MSGSADLQRKRQDATEAILNMQKVDLNQLGRERDLGDLNFKEVIPTITNLVDLYRQIPTSIVNDLPIPLLYSLWTRSTTAFRHIQEIRNFSLMQNGDVKLSRSAIISNIRSVFNDSFSELVSIASYAASKNLNYTQIEQRTIETLGHIQNESNNFSKQMGEYKKEAEHILSDIKNVSAERGVSQEAHHFQQEALTHLNDSNKWFIGTIVMSILVIGYSIGSLFLNKLIKTDSLYETIQLGISKVLIFGTLSYILYLCTKNYLAHRHNAVINKHRQNALMTYRVLANASDEQNKSIILTHASACIYSPQNTGYSNIQLPEGPNINSVVELVSKAAGK